MGQNTTLSALDQENLKLGEIEASLSEQFKHVFKDSEMAIERLYSMLRDGKIESIAPENGRLNTKQKDLFVEIEKVLAEREDAFSRSGVVIGILAVKDARDICFGTEHTPERALTDGKSKKHVEILTQFEDPKSDISREILALAKTHDKITQLEIEDTLDESIYRIDQLDEESLELGADQAEREEQEQALLAEEVRQKGQITEQRELSF